MKAIALSEIQARLLRALESASTEAGGGEFIVTPRRLLVDTDRSSVADALRRLEQHGVIRVVGGPTSAGYYRRMTIALTGKVTGYAASAAEINAARREARLAAGGTSAPDRPGPRDSGAFTRRWLELGLPLRGYAFLSG